MSDNRMLYRDLERVLITKEEIKKAVKALGERLNEDYAGKRPVLVCILKGAALFFSDLIRQLDLQMTLDFMAISSYGNSTQSSGAVRILKDMEQDVNGKDIIVVEDIVDSGLTLSYIQTVLLARGARSVRLVTLLDKPSRRQNDLKVDYSCFEIPNEFVVGYGLDYRELYRNLPEVGILHPRLYS